MPTDKELMQQALEMLHHINKFSLPPASICLPGEIDDVMKAISVRLAQPEQEPVAWGVPNTRPTEKAQFMMLLHSPDGCQYPEQLVPLYTSPPQQPEQEPVAWTVQGLITDFSRDFSAYQTKTYTVPLYTAPPQREWVGLTDEEYETMAEHYVTNCYFDTLEYARAIETKLKEKNA